MLNGKTSAIFCFGISASQFAAMLVYKKLENKTEKCPHLTFSRKKKRNAKYIFSPPASLLGKTYGVLEFNAKKEDGLKGGRGNLLHSAMRRRGGREGENPIMFSHFSHGLWMGGHVWGKRKFPFLSLNLERESV